MTRFLFSGVQPPDPRCGPPPAAEPAHRPRYVIPGSHWLDPAYHQIPRPANEINGGWPFPREPWPGESETRAPGTGLITTVACPPTPQIARTKEHLPNPIMWPPIPGNPCPPTSSTPFVRPPWAPQRAANARR